MFNFVSPQPKKILIFVFFLILPFVIFWYQLPYISDWSIGNDYVAPHQLYIQMEPLFSIRMGSFPIHVPGFFGGQGLSALTMSQIFHPQAHLASLMPGYWTGSGIEANTFWRLLSLGFTQWFLYLFVRALKLNRLFSFLLSFFVVYNMRMLDTFRYWAALENYTAHLLLCASIGMYYLGTLKRWGALAILVSTYLLITGGHPQVMYFGFWTAMLVMGLMPFYGRQMVPDAGLEWKRKRDYYLKSALAVGSGMFLASVYLVPFYFDFMRHNGGRVGQDYAWALADEWAKGDILTLTNSIFTPLLSNVHGSFGGTALMLVPFLIPFLLLFKQKISKTITLMLGIISLVLLLAIPHVVPLYYIFWKFFPFVSSFRVPIRITQIIIFFLLLIFAWLVRKGRIEIRWAGKTRETPAYVALTSIALLLYSLYPFISFERLAKNEIFSPQYIHLMPDIIHWTCYGLGILSLIFVIAYGLWGKWRRLLGILCVLACVLQTSAFMYLGTWLEQVPESYDLEQITAKKRQSINFLSDLQLEWGLGSKDHERNLKFLRKYNMRFPFARLYWYVIGAESREDAYQKLASRPLAEFVILEHKDFSRVNATKLIEEDRPSGSVMMEYSAYNRFEYMVNTLGRAIFVVNLPYSSYWKARLNGKEVPLFRANGYQKAIVIPPGTHRVEFRYYSWAQTMGALMSLFSFLWVIFFHFVKDRKGRIKWVAFTVMAGLLTLAFVAWHQSFYSGVNLETQYLWSI